MRRMLVVMVLVIALISIIIGCTSAPELAPVPSTSPVPAPEPAPAPIPTPTPPAPAPAPSPGDTGGNGVDAVPVSATYKLDFIADWSMETHPNDYPRGAHFSPLVAYSHDDSVESLIFTEGQQPSPGIEQMAETGGTGTLNQEIGELINSNLAYNKTQGRVFISPGADSAELEFTVDYNRITFVSMVAPSPDWFVAQTTTVMKDKDWMDTIELVLITYDAGSDSGEAFTSQDIDTQPKEPVTVFPDTIQRLGRLVLTRINSN